MKKRATTAGCDDKIKKTHDDKDEDDDNEKVDYVGVAATGYLFRGYAAGGTPKDAPTSRGVN